MLCSRNLIEGDDLKNENPARAIELLEKVAEMEKNLGTQVKWYLLFYICFVQSILL